jgi:hypothetical protein
MCHRFCKRGGPIYPKSENGGNDKDSCLDVELVVEEKQRKGNMARESRLMIRSVEVYGVGMCKSRQRNH